jgi:ribosomal protein L24
MLPDLVAARRVNQIALQTGYNVNRFSDALHTDWLRKIPGIGGYNKWLFEEFQRGLMMDTYRHEFDRIKQQNPQKSDMEVGRQVSKDLNALFGNMMSQGWIKSATANDLARLFYLAPSWNMGRIASEFGGFGQAAKNVKDSAFQKRMLAGSLTKSMGTIALAYFVANQFINYLTRGQPTWENKDDYTGAKISAWIPDFMGGKSQGMWLNPMGLVAEITHQIVERAHKRKDVLAALSDVNQYKLSNFGKSAWVLATGEDWMQNHLHDWDRVKEALKQGAPVPIPANTISALVQGEEYPGQIQKQTLSSFGLKTDLKKDTAKDRLNAQKGMSWKDRVNAAKVDASERVRTDDDRVKLMATRKAAEALYDRTQELRAGLSKEMVKWLADKKLRLTGYEDRIVIQGANVQLTDEEREQYGKIMQREYSLAIQKFMQENTDKLSQQQKQARFESRLNAAKNKARTAMLKTLK